MDMRVNHNLSDGDNVRRNAISAENLRYPADANCKRLLRQIQEIDFALMDTKLFLDAYPDNMEAMKYFNELLETRNTAAAAYRAQCGPLIAYERIDNNAWLWINGPWPWEYDAN